MMTLVAKVEHCVLMVHANVLMDTYWKMVSAQNLVSDSKLEEYCMQVGSSFVLIYFKTTICYFSSTSSIFILPLL